LASFSKAVDYLSFDKKNKRIFPVDKMCEVLQVRKRCCNQCKIQSVSESKERIILVKEKINSIYFDSQQRY